MKFDRPAGTNPIDQLKVVGKALDRIDGPLKTTGRASYAYERQDAVPNQAYGYVVGSGIAKGRIRSMDIARARTAAGVRAIVTAENAGRLGKGRFNTARLLGGPEIQHYHQAIAIVVADTFEQARAAAEFIRVDLRTAQVLRSRQHLVLDEWTRSRKMMRSFRLMLLRSKSPRARTRVLCPLEPKSTGVRLPISPANLR